MMGVKKPLKGGAMRIDLPQGTGNVYNVGAESTVNIILSLLRRVNSFLALAQYSRHCKTESIRGGFVTRLERITQDTQSDRAKCDRRYTRVKHRAACLCDSVRRGLLCSL